MKQLAIFLCGIVTGVIGALLGFVVADVLERPKWSRRP